MKDLEEELKWNTWKATKKGSFPPNANTLNRRVVLAIMNKISEIEVFKARFVAQVQGDKEKESLGHDYPLMTKYAIKTVFLKATVLDFHMWSQDIQHTYLQ